MRRVGYWLLVTALVVTVHLFLAGCSLRGSLAAESSSTPAPTATAAAPTETQTATATVTPIPPSHTPTRTVTPAPSATPTPDPSLGHFLLVGRPVPPHASLTVVASYRYGATNQGRFETHHGDEFANPANTQLIAAAPGTVQYAGDDLGLQYGPAHNFYGNLVVLQLDEMWHGHRVYALYGHMLAVAVAPGQHVQTGDLVGYVGQSGVALGPHLHLEVRLDNPTDYDSTRNPELWLQPLPGTGALAGRVIDRRGRFIRDARVNIACADGKRRFADTYHDDTVTPDDDLQENFAYGDVPAGECTLSVDFVEGSLKQTVTVADGRLTLVEFQEP